MYCSDCHVCSNANHAVSMVSTAPRSSSRPVAALVHCDLADNRDGIVSYIEAAHSEDHRDGEGDRDRDSDSGGGGGGAQETDAPVFCLNSVTGGDWRSPVDEGKARSPTSSRASRMAGELELELYAWPKFKP